MPDRVLGQSEIVGLRLASVSVTVAPDAIKSWPEGEGKTNADGSEAPVRFLTQAEGEKRLVEKLRSAMSAKVGAVLSGKRPVRAVVTVREFNIVPKSDRMARGGMHQMKVDVVLVDAQSGKELMSYRDQDARQSAGSGAGGVVGGLIGGGLIGAATIAAVNASAASREINADILVAQFVEDYTNWLTNKPAAQQGHEQGRPVT